MKISREEAIDLGGYILDQLGRYPDKEEITLVGSFSAETMQKDKPKAKKTKPMKKIRKSYAEMIADPEPPVRPYQSYQKGNYVEPGEGPVAEGIIKDYMEGVPLHVIEGRYTVSAGQIYSHLNMAGVPLRVSTGKKLKNKLAHLTLEDYEAIANDYKNRNMPLTAIYEKYNIHKNGLYYILDSMDIDRRQKK